MESDTGLDVAWCLTCSRSTRDARNPYCSDACRQADGNPPKASSSRLPLASPSPAALYSPPLVKQYSDHAPQSDRRRSSASPTKAGASRPPFASRTATFLPPASEAAFSPPKVTAGRPRDRRAFSFPSAPNSPPLLFPVREHRGSTTLPPFARRDIIANLAPNSPALLSVKEDGRKYHDILAKRLTKSTGGNNTPGTGGDSVFMSTSESSEDEDETRARSSAVPAAPLPRIPRSSALEPTTSTQFSTLRSQLTLGRASLQTRNTSTSPVGAMIASSASSRSREDIISWAKAINRRDGAEPSEDDSPRGRPRTQRISSLAKVPLTSNESLDPHPEEDMSKEDNGSNGYGTTPKGRIGSALAGLGGYAVKAFTSVTASPNRPTPPRKPSAPSLLGVSALDVIASPSPAEVSRIAVVASTMPLDDGTSSHYLPGGPATLSTISFSEAVDPSVIDTHDQVDIVTDDMSVTSSGFNARRRGSKYNSRKGSITSVPPPVPGRQSAARPLTSSIWNLSSYLSRFSPFAIPSIVSPHSSRPSQSTQTSNASTVPTTSMSSPTATPIFEPTSPLPALRSRPDTPESPAQQLVRSVPMDIAIPSQPIGSEVIDYQVQRSPVEQSRLRSSRSRARSRSRRRSRSRSRSAGRALDRAELNAQYAELAKGVGMSNQDPDADADISDEESEGARGGDRSRERGRDRGRVRDESEEVGGGRGRGRDRSVKAT